MRVSGLTGTIVGEVEELNGPNRPENGLHGGGAILMVSRDPMVRPRGVPRNTVFGKFGHCAIRRVIFETRAIRCQLTE